MAKLIVSTQFLDSKQRMRMVGEPIGENDYDQKTLTGYMDRGLVVNPESDSEKKAPAKKVVAKKVATKKVAAPAATKEAAPQETK